MKKLKTNKNILFTLALLISVVSFGQNYPFEISNKFIKLTDEQAYEFLKSSHKTLKDLEFADAYNVIVKDFNVYKLRGEELMFENVLVHKTKFNFSIEDVYYSMYESRDELSIENDIFKGELIDIGTKLFSSKYKYFYYSMNFLDFSSNRERIGYIYLIRVKNDIYQININSVDGLDIDDLILSISEY